MKVLLASLLLFSQLLYAGESANDSGKRGELHFNLEFAGGTLKELLDNVKKSARIETNIILDEDAAALKIQKLKLKFITLTALSKTLKSLAPELEVKRNEQDVLHFSLKKAARHHRFFNVAALIKNRDIEDIHSLILSAWEVAAGKSSGEVKFHEKTAILIVVGTPEEIRIVEELILELEKNK